MEKQEALIRGDISNTVVDRYFVYALQIHGAHVCGVPEGTPAMIQLLARYIQMALESLIRLKKTNQERTKAQALVSLTHASINVGFAASAQLYLLKACKIIEKAELRFLAKGEPPVELSDQIREEVSVLSQLIYLENYLYLTFGGSAPARTVGIEREFRLDLQVRSVQYFPVVEPKTDLEIWSSKCTHASSTYAHWPCELKVFCWSETRF